MFLEIYSTSFDFIHLNSLFIVLIFFFLLDFYFKFFLILLNAKSRLLFSLIVFLLNHLISLKRFLYNIFWISHMHLLFLILLIELFVLIFIGIVILSFVFIKINSPLLILSIFIIISTHCIISFLVKIIS